MPNCSNPLLLGIGAILHRLSRHTWTMYEGIVLTEKKVPLASRVGARDVAKHPPVSRTFLPIKKQLIPKTRVES